MIFKKGELKLLWPFYLVYLLFGLSAVILPFMIIYFQDLGLNYLQLSIVAIATGLGIVVFEVPTGVVADIFSRKYSVIIGFFLTGLTVILVPFTSNFYLLVILMFFSGAGMSFISGAEEAWVIDNLSAYKRDDLKQEFFLKMQITMAFGLILAPIIGAIITKSYSMKWLWVLYGIAFFINVIILAFFTEEKYVPKKINFFKGLKNTFANSKKGFEYILKNKVISLLVLAGVLATFIDIGLNGHQPFLVGLSMPEYGLGYVYAVMAIFIIAASFATRLLAKYKVRMVISIITLIRMLLYIAIFFVSPPYFLIGAALIIFYGTFVNLGDPILSTYLHKNIKTDIRATVISVRSMVITLAIVIIRIIGGYLMDILGPQKVIALGGILGMFALVTYWKIKD